MLLSCALAATGPHCVVAQEGLLKVLLARELQRCRVAPEMPIEIELTPALDELQAELTDEGLELTRADYTESFGDLRSWSGGSSKGGGS